MELIRKFIVLNIYEIIIPGDSSSDSFAYECTLAAISDRSQNAMIYFRFPTYLT